MAVGGGGVGVKVAGAAGVGEGVGVSGAGVEHAINHQAAQIRKKELRELKGLRELSDSWLLVMQNL